MQLSTARHDNARALDLGAIMFAAAKGGRRSPLTFTFVAIGAKAQARLIAAATVR